MAQVLKVEYHETLRRVSFPKSEFLSFNSLKQRIVDLFQLPACVSLVITYLDNEKDVVAMVNDTDLRDALLLQGLNPLRLFVRGAESPTTSADVKPPAASSSSLVLTTAQKAAFTNVSVAVKEVDDRTSALAPPAEVASCVSSADELALVTPEVPSVREPAPAVSAAKSMIALSSCPSSVLTQEAEVEKSGVPETAAEASTPLELVVHVMVECDVCKTLPILGIRYNSLVRHNYDLCRSCFAKHGKAEDYNAFDRPVVRPFRRSPTGGLLRAPVSPLPATAALAPLVAHPAAMPRPAQAASAAASLFKPDPKMDSLFVKDVTVYDGMEISSGTGFTKTWRLRNSGTLPWLPHTCLVYVSGDKMQTQDFVDAQVPEQGLRPGEEAEVSVAMVAPQKPGRYASHWRLMGPGGKKFGNRVWAVIQVVPPAVSIVPLVNTRGVALEPAKVCLEAPSTVSGSAASSTSWAGGPALSSPVSKASEISLFTKTSEVPAPLPSTAGPQLKPLEGKEDHLPEKSPAGDATAVLANGKTAVDECAVEQAANEQFEVGLSVAEAPAVVDKTADVEGSVLSKSTSAGSEPGEGSVKDGVQDSESPRSDQSVDSSFSFVELPDSVEGEHTSLTSAALPTLEVANTEELKEDEPVVVSLVETELSMKEEAPVMDTSSVDKTVVAGAPVVDAPETAPPAATRMADAPVPQAPAVEQTPEVIMEEHLAHLKVMGFTDSDLNEEILKECKLDLQKAIDELVVVSSWDPLVEELAEMGFEDMSLSRRLLQSNKGNMKGAVKDLVKQYKKSLGGGKA